MAMLLVRLPTTPLTLPRTLLDPCPCCALNTAAFLLRARGAKLGRADKDGYTPVGLAAWLRQAALTTQQRRHNHLQSRTELYSWGVANHQLGYAVSHGNQGVQGAPRRLDVHSSHTQGQLASLSAGHSHTLVATSSGRVLVWGVGEARVGLGGQTSSIVPTIIKSLLRHTIVKVAAGRGHSLALTDNVRTHFGPCNPRLSQRIYCHCFAGLCACVG